MNIGIQILTSNLGIGLEDLCLFVALLVSLIAYARDMTIGLMTSFIFTAVLTIIWISLGTPYDYTHSLYICMLFLVFLAFSLFSNVRNAAQGVV